ncbi:MAG: hypothetical protein QXK84_06375 [Nitrososphaerota archaeon]
MNNININVFHNNVKTSHTKIENGDLSPYLQIKNSPAMGGIVRITARIVALAIISYNLCQLKSNTTQ